MAADGAQLVEFGAVVVGNDISLVQQLRRIGLYLLVDAVAQRLAEAQLLPHPLQGLVAGRETGHLHGAYGCEGILQLHHLARTHPAHGHLGDDALEVAHAVELVVHTRTEVGLLEEIVHNVEPLVDGAHVFQRKHHPAAQQPAAHRRDRAVDDIEQRQAVFLHGLEEFERPGGELVEPHKLVFLYAGKGRDMADVRVLGEFQILHDGSRGYDAVFQVVYTESLERLRAEMLQEFLPRTLVGEHPVVKLKGAETRTEITLEVLFAGPVVEHLLGLEVAQQFLHIVVGALPGEKLARGDVQKAHAAGPLAEVYSRQEVVLLVVEHIVAHGHARRHQFGDAPLHHLVHLRKALLALDLLPLLLRVFKLVADGHTLPRSDELGQVGVEGMVGKSRHLGHGCRPSVVAARERDAQHACRLHGILAVGLVEVAAAKQQQRLRVLRLHVEELAHHRSKSFFVYSHLFFKFSLACKDNVFSRDGQNYPLKS